MELKANKSVRFGGDTDLKFSKLSEKLGRSKQELFGQMVDYFYKSQKDPGDLNDELLKKELGQGINRIISFIKTQEKEALTPILADGRELQRNLTAFVRLFSRFFRVDAQNYVYGFFEETHQKRATESVNLLTKQTDLEKKQQSMADKLDKMLQEARTYQSEVKLHQEEKKALKAKFGAILRHYMLQREALNSLTQGRALRELEENVQQQLNNL